MSKFAIGEKVLRVSPDHESEVAVVIDVPERFRCMDNMGWAYNNKIVWIARENESDGWVFKTELKKLGASN